jgi:antitoxin VapB
LALNIKDPSAERLARELSAATGEGLTRAIRTAVEERLARVRRDHGGRDIGADLRAIGAHCAALPDLDGRSAEEILGYDDNGLPS